MLLLKAAPSGIVNDDTLASSAEKSPLRIAWVETEDKSL